MVYRKATYEEYCKASEFAKFRYKFGVYIQLIAALLLLFLIYYTVSNIEEMKANPVDYAKEKMGVICFPQGGFILGLGEESNGSIRNIENIRKE